MKPTAAQVGITLLVAAAGAAGVIAAMSGGDVEDALDWIFFGVPVTAVVVLGAYGLARRRF